MQNPEDLSTIEERFAFYFGNDTMPTWLKAKLQELGPAKEECLIMSIPNFKQMAADMFPAANSNLWSGSFHVWQKIARLQRISGTWKTHIA